MKYDVVIIGGGASGLCTSILIKRNKPEFSVAIIEAQNRVAKKLLTTGNGRCNITNRYLNIRAYHGTNAEFCQFALTKYDFNFTVDFFESIGIPLTEGENGKMFPYSLQAASVVDALRLEAIEYGVDIFLGEPVKSISKNGRGYVINTNEKQFNSKNIVIAAGGIVGGNALILDKNPYRLLTDLGHKIVKPNASLVQLKTDLTKIKALNGIKLNCKITAIKDGMVLRSESGELLFTKYGISGPPVLQISRCFIDINDAFVKINFMWDKNYQEVSDLLLSRRNLLKRRNAEYFFTGIFPKMLGHTLLKLADININAKISSITDKQLKQLTENIMGFKLKVTGHNGFENAQVTAGGLYTNEFNPKTMESLKNKGIYAVGEILDIDGDCGGYNLQWAWSSAAAASEGICNDTFK